MRSILILVLVAMGIAVMLTNARQPQASKPPAANPSRVSDHNWAKKSLDRTADVKRQVAGQRADDETR